MRKLRPDRDRTGEKYVRAVTDIAAKLAAVPESASHP
jgi:hypothetical protein